MCGKSWIHESNLCPVISYRFSALSHFIARLTAEENCFRGSNKYTRPCNNYFPICLDITALFALFCFCTVPLTYQCFSWSCCHRHLRDQDSNQVKRDPGWESVWQRWLLHLDGQHKNKLKIEVEGGKMNEKGPRWLFSLSNRNTHWPGSFANVLCFLAVLTGRVARSGLRLCREI